MAYKYREEIVGKRFVSVSGFSKVKLNKINEWGWRAGVIRAASHRDNTNKDLQVLVEYDGVEWHRREWLSPYRDAVFSFFLIEKGLAWIDRPDPRHSSLINVNHSDHVSNNNHQPHRINGKPLRGSTASAPIINWPAVTFYPLVARAELPEDAMPVEFMQDRRLDFLDYAKLKPFTHDWEVNKNSAIWGDAVRRWVEMQDGQSILLTTPSVLVGFRVEVYRAEGTTQWYTAVIVGYNEATKDLTVTDDTVLEDHNEDPCLVQMRLIGDGVVESIMRGDVVGMTPRRSRSSTALTHALVMPRVGRKPRGRPGAASNCHPPSRTEESAPATLPAGSPTRHLEKVKSSSARGNNRRRQASESSGREKFEKGEKSEWDGANVNQVEEDRENKGPAGNRGGNRGRAEEVGRRSIVGGTGTGTGVKLRRRGAPVKHSSESSSVQRSVKRRVRTTSVGPRREGLGEKEERSEAEARLVAKASEESGEDGTVGPGTGGGGEEEEGEDCDPLINRLKASPVGRKVRRESRKDEEVAGVPEEQGSSRLEEPKRAKDSEDEESESRERDREPEPPPEDVDVVDPSSRDTGDAAVEEEEEEEEEEEQVAKRRNDREIATTTDVAATERRIIVETRVDEEIEVVGYLDRSVEPDLVEGNAEENASGATRAASVESVVELVESSSQDGSVLERLSPLSSGAGGRHGLLLDDQERDQHNESPVILAERLNKPPPPPGAPITHHHLQHQQLHHRHQQQPQHHQYGAPVNQHPHHHHHNQHQHQHLDHNHRHHHYQHPQQQQQQLQPRDHQPPQQQQQHRLQQQQQQQQQQHHRYSSGSPVVAQHHQATTSANGAPTSSPRHLGSVATELPQHQHHQHHHHHHQQQQQQQQPQTSSTARVIASVGDEASLMEVEAVAGGVAGVLGGVPTAGIRGAAYGDSGSDSGVSSLRSTGSGDERSGSRSSALSAEETPAATPARVWHVQSVQHTSLLMAHPQTGPPPPATGQTSTTAVGYQSPAQPAHHVPTSAVSTEMLWRPANRYPPLTHGLLGPVQPTPEEMLERERHERMLRERREAEAREREREKMEQERLEHQKSDPTAAVQKHFEESLRRMVQKGNIPPTSMGWSNIIPLPPHANRSHGGHSALPPHSGHHHPGAPTGTPHPVTVAQQQQLQQQQRERDKREAREREAVAREREREREREQRVRDQREHIAVTEHFQRQADAHHRAAYYGTSPSVQQVSRPSNVSGKVEYPPPAHSRQPKSSLSSSGHHEKTGSSVVPPPHTGLPKAEPNVNLFGYTYQTQPQYMHDIKVKPELQHKQMVGKSMHTLDRDHHGREMLPNPPPLLSDHKSSVIVKNEGRELSKAPPSHSPSPKLMSSHYLNPVVPQHKPPSGYEYRSPTQSPHHLHPLDSLQAAKTLSQGGHHRGNASQLSSPHGHPAHPHNRQSPHAQHPHQTPHPSPPEAPRYLSRPELGPPYAAPKPSYSYPHPPSSSPTPHYTAPPGSKPKVSSPAPQHMYGKPGAMPNSGIMTGTPVCRASADPVAPAPLPLTSKASLPPTYLQQVPHQHGPSPGPLPPPAHSSRPLYDSRAYVASLSASKLHAQPLHGSPPSANSSAPSPLQRQAPRPDIHHRPPPPPTQTQPLDLGVERSGSPKRKAPTPIDACGQSVSSFELASNNSKKRRTEDIVPQPLSLQCVGPPVLSRVSEPSPLIASAATSITTVVNTALLAQRDGHQSQERTVISVSPAPRTASGDGSPRPASTGSVSSLNPGASAAPSPAPTQSPAPSAAPSPAPSAPGTPAKTQTPQPVGADSDKSNSPAPRPPSSTSYPVHKLKKAWLQRHSGEDGTEDTTGMVGGGTCVKLPVPIIQTPSQPQQPKEREPTSATSVTTATTTTSTTTSSSPVNSIHNIGSMAVNSISKTKVTGKSGSASSGGTGRKTNSKESLNGHAADAKTLQEDSSSSDPERKSPPKRKPPKVKRKKGAARRQQAAVEEHRRKKDEKSGVAGSESSNESEAGSASDASEQLGSIQAVSRARNATVNSNSSSNGGTGNKEPRKRGRRPKTSTKGNELGNEEQQQQQPKPKKERRDESASGGGSSCSPGGGGGGGRNDPFRKPPIAQLKKTGESWLQDGACFEVAPKLAKCRECRWTPHQRSKNVPQNIFCRFYAFRRLRYTKNGQLAIAGFSDPHKDASEEDLRLWLPVKDGRDVAVGVKEEKFDKNEKVKIEKSERSDKEDLDLEMGHRLLCQVGDQFCDLLHQEKDAHQEHMAEASSGITDGTVAWKRVVQGVREMCDVCETTLFNFHWACAKCGFVVCIDCYKGRKNETIKIWGESGKDRDEFSWLLCTNRQAHEPERLMLTQIIAGDGLSRLGTRLHATRSEWGIPQHCSCSLTNSSPVNETLRNLIKGESIGVMNGNVKQEIKGERKENGSTNKRKSNGDEKKSPLSWLADVALQNQEKNESGSSSDSDEDRDGNYSTLRELLIRPSHKPNGNGSRSNSPTNNSGNSRTSSNPTANNAVKSGKKSKMDTLDEVISSVIEHSTKKERGGGFDEKAPRELKHFVRRYKWTQRGREPLPIRIMTLTESKSLYPNVPHSWLCDGKLLRLNEPNNPNNYQIFQDQWKRGQPVIVSDVSKSLDANLWHPDSFARDFGDEKNDLVNCMTGNLVPNQPMRKFWEGFEHFSKRLKDERGNPMLLKLKDWPPGEDFAELLPSRFHDLMKVLPLSEYTHRNGRLNLASRLPDCFVRPDLGPKMYNAYGSALYPNKGTTNLHLDISDAVNVMVYVGIPKDGDNDEHVKEALRAIDEAGCDILTRRRVRDRGEAPGALWHIYAARDADKIRDLLNAVALERGARLEPHHDPIHDQSCYLDGPLRERLYREYGVEGYAIVQCLGDAVFVPAGAPHQVRNLHNCIKVAEDFVSPENVSHCFHLTQEFRALSDTHTNHEDKLQIKNIIYHAVKDSVTVLENVKREVLAKSKPISEMKIKEVT